MADTLVEWDDISIDGVTIEKTGQFESKVTVTDKAKAGKFKVSVSNSYKSDYNSELEVELK